MELRDYSRRDPTSPPEDWEPTSPSIARKPINASKLSPSPYTSPDYATTSFSQRAAQPFLPRQNTTDTAYYGASTPLGIWEPTEPHAPGSGRPQAYREDSQASLLIGGGGPRDLPPNMPPAGHGPPPPTPPHNNGFWDWWHHNWKPSWSMYILVLSGIAFAIGHHFYYEALHNKVANDQQGKLRYGALLAFLSKACFLNAVVLAFRQRVLMMIRRKMLTLATLDSLFAASEDLTALLNWEAWVNAKFAMALTIFIWTSPLIVIFTSYTLTVKPQKKQEITQCANIRTLNFEHEREVYWRTPAKVDNYFETSVSLWNTTAAGESINKTDPNEFDYYTGGSQQFESIALKTAYAQQTIMRPNAPKEICGAGWNCSYTIEFTGPGYKCTTLAEGVNAEVKKLGNAKCPFDTNDIAPMGNYTYYAMLDRGDYENPQIKEAEIGGRPKQKPPYPKHLGVFRTEPILWFGYADVEDRDKPQPPEPRKGDWYKAYTPIIFGCEHYQTKYKVQLNYTGGVQSHNVTSRKFVKKLIDTTLIPDKKDPDKRLKDRTVAEPEENYVYPQNISDYRLTAAYHAVGYQLRAILNGTTTMPHFNVNSKILQTRLVDRLNYLPVKDFPLEVQKFYEEILLSFLSDPQMSAVSWAAKPSNYSGTIKSPKSLDYSCIRWQERNCFFYNFAQLWAVYAISMGITILAVASGVAAMEENAIMRSLSFSAILAASRASSLDKLRWEQEAELKSRKIGFGIVADPTGERTYSFGVEGDVSQEKTATVATGRSPGLSVMNWGDRTARRMSYAVLNKKDRPED
ncbi:unnamed protein product [Fusarium graminearum]|uniref:Chromosome 1, complete genome n=2 Tax=Gibberella zeae TaxID=5518 RepID=I1RG40_GIBZE|nr:hypothetical protein FGSG_02689 [Fusarium graminearum PH-1]EYB31980.1 hypothetical protein FG05_02689 [Fusarium graminearum]ESU08155.1 hypothetical protein FGSG_02689 [Fusarium graminearum PH-1]KAI6750290.1 hypothetical protein HG531_007555 [Fusarium graminearum]PCD36474.1 hypothetical protein FGRA07_08358 [Fusarium graminearum]CAF3437830.1 unnamed protein product [Fusarium graminearum]|eukprot:XP_011318640.1 hypothetical protein FGSG_02689 [Fusarium graminearum PH-1]